MKSFTLTLFLVFVIAFTSCGKKDEVKQEVKKDEVKKEEVKDDLLKGLFYQEELSKQYGENLASSRLSTKEEKRTFAYSLNIYYKGDWKDYKKDEFKSTAEKIGKYPAIIDSSSYSIIIDVQVQPGVLVSVLWQSDALKGYNKLEPMKKLAVMFDFEGIEKLTGDKISGVELAKYFPKFEVNK